MPDDQQDQNGAPGETMAAFVARRNREKANAALGPLAAHQAYGDSIRTGGDLSFPHPADLTNFVPSLLGGTDSGQGGQNWGQFGGGFELQNGSQTQAYEPQDARRTAQPPSAQSGKTGPEAQPNLHPGFAESLIPVWGSGKEAYADFKDHNYGGAILNGLLAGSDLFLGADIAKAFAKGGLYALKGPIGEAASKQTWKAVRRRMGKEGMMEFRQEGHHWAIPQGDWGKSVPDVIKNHPLNIKAMPEQAMHRRIHGRWKGAPKFGQFERYRYGTPTWSKVATFDFFGHPIAAATTDDTDQ